MSVNATLYSGGPQNHPRIPLDGENLHSFNIFVLRVCTLSNFKSEQRVPIKQVAFEKQQTVYGVRLWSSEMISIENSGTYMAHSIF